MEMLRKAVIVALLVLLPGFLFAAGFVVKAAKGDAAVRHGVSEQWVRLNAGDVLGINDAVSTGANSTITFQVPNGSTIRIPEYALLELSDLRNLTQEELLLKLAMENIRNVPRNRREGIVVPSTTVVHGANKSSDETLPVPDNSRLADMQITGARVLFGHNYYGTCILRTKEVVRLYPEMTRRAESHLLVAESFERLGLAKDALAEYSSLLALDLPQAQRAAIDAKMERLRGTLKQ
jgi:hypothetical protein